MSDADEWITCVCADVEDYLTYGGRYKLLATDEERLRVRVLNDFGRTRWYPLYQFDQENRPAPTLTRWQFDEEVRNENCDLVEVSFELSDGSLRWLHVGTPDYIKHLLEERSDPAQWGSALEPALCGPYLMVIRRLSHEAVDWMLRHLDRQGELFSISRAFLPSPIEEDEDNE